MTGIWQDDRNMTGRQEYDRTKDRQRILDEYMIDVFYPDYEISGSGWWSISFFSISGYHLRPDSFSAILPQAGKVFENLCILYSICRCKFKPLYVNGYKISLANRRQHYRKWQADCIHGDQKLNLHASTVSYYCINIIYFSVCKVT